MSKILVDLEEGLGFQLSCHVGPNGERVYQITTSEGYVVLSKWSLIQLFSKLAMLVRGRF